MPCYHDAIWQDWKSTEDVELPRWLLPKDGKKSKKQRATLERVWFRRIHLISAIEYYCQCLEAEELPKEEMDEQFLILSILSSGNEGLKAYNVTKNVKWLLELACRSPRSPSDEQDTDSVEADAPLEYEPPPGSIYSNLGLYPDLETFRVLEVLPFDGVQIQSTLELADSRSRPYDALSYVWGPTSPSKPILVNGVEAHHRKGVCKWTDGNGHDVAIEYDSDKQYRLLVIASLRRDTLDALVALWCCRLWQ